jgi:hypothetical protein
MKRSTPIFPPETLPLYDFLSGGAILHGESFPWFNVSIRIGEKPANSLMVPSLDNLKKILAQRGPRLSIESIDYVTPGFMNGSGHWKMEPLLEVTELFNSFGWSIARCRVTNNRVYRGIRLEQMDEWTMEQPVYVAEQV